MSAVLNVHDLPDQIIFSLFTLVFKESYCRVGAEKTLPTVSLQLRLKCTLHYCAGCLKLEMFTVSCTFLLLDVFYNNVTLTKYMQNRYGFFQRQLISAVGNGMLDLILIVFVGLILFSFVHGDLINFHCGKSCLKLSYQEKEILTFCWSSIKLLFLLYSLTLS